MLCVIDEDNELKKAEAPLNIYVTPSPSCLYSRRPFQEPVPKGILKEPMSCLLLSILIIDLILTLSLKSWLMASCSACRCAAFVMHRKKDTKIDSKQPIGPAAGKFVESMACVGNAVFRSGRHCPLFRQKVALPISADETSR